MPWEIEQRDGEYCVIKIETGSSEGCHGTKQEAINHMRALYASEEKAMPSTARAMLEGKIHRAYTTTSDDLYAMGYINRDQRLEIGRFLGELLTDFGDKIDRLIPPTMVIDGGDVIHIATKDMDESRLASLKKVISNTIHSFFDSEKSRQNEKGVYTFKDGNGEWWLLGIVTNNRMDREGEILTADSHRYFVNAIESGLYKEIMGHDMPEFWIHHIPVPVGDAKMVAYDERGFLITAIKQRAGEFYTKVFEGLAKISSVLGMSHGMPNPYLKKEKGADGLSYITQYLSKEFTALRIDKAANFLTGSVLAVKELYGDMYEIDEEKRKFLVDTFGEELAGNFDQRVKDLANAAEAAGIPKKEFSMAEDKEKEALDQKETADQPETQVKEEETQPVTEVKADMPPEEEEEEEEQAPSKKKEEPEYMTVADGKLMADEIVKGLKEAFAPVVARIDALETEFKQYREEEDRVRKQVELSPFAGLASRVGKAVESSVVGREETAVDGRKKEFKGPEETKPEIVEGGTGIAAIDRMIAGSRRNSANHVIPYLAPNASNGQ